MRNRRSELGLPTKIASGGFALLFISSVLFYNGWVFSTTLPRYIYMMVATVILLAVASLLLVNDLV